METSWLLLNLPTCGGSHTGEGEVALIYMTEEGLIEWSWLMQNEKGLLDDKHAR